MCGIAGIYNPRGVDLNEVIELSQILKHRGPDDEGFYIGNPDFAGTYRGKDTITDLQRLKHVSEVGRNSNLALVHRRLSILDVSALGHQPYVSDDENYVLVFNGEVYNYKEIRKELEQKGHTFISDSDTEVVLKAFIEWGKSCVSRFVGMWAFTIYNRQENTFMLSRDRYGIKPLYYFQNNNYFAFASEIKGLLKLKDVDKGLYKENLGSYLAIGTMSNPYQKLLQNIQDIEP